jgi:poly-gamma-glutamate synthesis protein (capsule biosynthesis protein)
LLDKAKIAHAGAGKDKFQASMPAVVGKKQETIGLIAFTDNEPGWQAETKKPGLFYVPADLEDPRTMVLLELVKRTKQRTNCLIVSAHWGGNWGYEPPAEHSLLARAIIDAGADIVFGHSPHVFRGIEIYRGKPILYSTGDFIDDYAVDEIERNDESFIFIVEFINGKLPRLELFPTMIADFQARLAGNRARTIAAKMERLCQAFDTPTKWSDKTQTLNILISQ